MSEAIDELAIEFKKATDEHKKATDDVKKLADEITGRVAAGEQVAQGLKEQADEALTKMNGYAARLDDFEQKLARRGDDPAEARKSFGQQFVESKSFRDLSDSTAQRGRADIQIKATITSNTTDAAGSAGALVTPTRLPGIVTPPERRLTIRDLITPGQMGGNSLEYVRETGFTNNAGMVAELDRKPESDLKFDDVSTTAKVIAHYTKASRQILSDAPQLQSIIDGRLLYGLAFKEESQILYGDGTGQNLLGIVPQASAYKAPTAGVQSLNLVDTLRLAMLQAVLAEYPATGHVLNPVDWALVELLKDANGNYIVGNPQSNAARTLWGLPVVETQAIAQGKFLTGAYRLGAQLFDRWLARVEVSTENEDDFVRNRVTILAEERLALAVYRPEAFVYGDLKAAATGA